MKIEVECYGASARWCGAERLGLELADGATVADALDLLADRSADFAERRDRIAAAVDDAIAAPTQVLIDGDVLALIPPVSGG
jgi:molybdopterin converting factor small subunit